MTATLAAPTGASDAAPSGDDVDSPVPARPVPAALAPWQDPHPRFAWLSLAALTVLAVLTRFWDLGFPATRDFDEAYYAVEAQEMLRFGYEDNRGYTFIVHPPLGKWLIAGGEWLWDGGQAGWLTNSIGWRIAPAVFGVAGVVIITRTVRRMTRSSAAGALAGLLLCLEGMSLVLARNALLDIFLQTFVLAGFAALVVDRDTVRARLAGMIADGVDLTDGTPSLGPRPWRMTAGVLLGLACAVKWTGLSFFVLFAIVSLVWDRAAFKSAGVRQPTRTWLPRSVVPGLGSLFVAPVGAYLLTYLGWFVGENAWDRHWADAHAPANAVSALLPGPLRSLISWTHEAYTFHEGLDSPHIYQSNPWSWLVAGRGVDFYYNGSGTACGASACSRQVILLATPILWWGFLPALLWVLWRWATARDWRAAAVLVAFAAGWLVWFQDLKRTMFFFYMAPLVPFLVMALVMMLGAMLGRESFPGSSGATAGVGGRHGGSRATGPAGLTTSRVGLGAGCLAAVLLSAGFLPAGVARDAAVALFGFALLVLLLVEIVDRYQAGQPGARRRFWGGLAVAVFLGAVAGDFAYMWPLFTGELLTFGQWHAHMWLPSWV